jgi:flagellar biogenesis protein FliO
MGSTLRHRAAGQDVGYRNGMQQTFLRNPKPQTRKRLALGAMAAVWCAICCSTVSAQTTKPQGVSVSGPFEQKAIKRTVDQAAATKGANPAAQSKWDLVKVPVALGGVILFIFALRAGGRAMLRTRGRQPSSSAIEVLSRSTISPRQQLMLVRVGRRLVLVGNSGSELSALCQIENPEEVAEVLGQLSADKSEAKSFRKLVGRAGKEYDTAASAAAESEEDENDLPAAGLIEADLSTTETREELSGLMDRVRRISQQFQKS